MHGCCWRCVRSSPSMQDKGGVAAWLHRSRHGTGESWRRHHPRPRRVGSSRGEHRSARTNCTPPCTPLAERQAAPRRALAARQPRCCAQPQWHWQHRAQGSWRDGSTEGSTTTRQRPRPPRPRVRKSPLAPLRAAGGRQQRGTRPFKPIWHACRRRGRRRLRSIFQSRHRCRGFISRCRASVGQPRRRGWRTRARSCAPCRSRPRRFGRLSGGLVLWRLGSTGGPGQPPLPPPDLSASPRRQRSARQPRGKWAGA